MYADVVCLRVSTLSSQAPFATKLYPSSLTLIRYPASLSPCQNATPWLQRPEIEVVLLWKTAEALWNSDFSARACVRSALCLLACLTVAFSMIRSSTRQVWVTRGRKAYELLPWVVGDVVQLTLPALSVMCRLRQVHGIVARCAAKEERLALRVEHEALASV